TLRGGEPARRNLLRRSQRVSGSAGDTRTAADGDARARARRSTARTVARPLCRRRRQQHRSRSGAGSRRARQRAVHLRALWIQRVEGAAGSLAGHRGKCRRTLPRRVPAMSKRIPILIAVVVVIVVAAGAWVWATSGRESTDDAQVEAHVTPIAARVGGTVLNVPVIDNQQVEAG